MMRLGYICDMWLLKKKGYICELVWGFVKVDLDFTKYIAFGFQHFMQNGYY